MEIVIYVSSEKKNMKLIKRMNKLIGFDCLHGVVERGNNTNGNYIKFGDGTLICTKQLSYSNVAFDHTQGSVYFSSGLQLGAPAKNFISTPLFIRLNFPSNGYAWDFGVRNSTASNLGSVQLIRGTGDSQNITLDVFAIGRWK